MRGGAVGIECNEYQIKYPRMFSMLYHIFYLQFYSRQAPHEGSTGVARGNRNILCSASWCKFFWYFILITIHIYTRNFVQIISIIIFFSGQSIRVALHHPRSRGYWVPWGHLPWPYFASTRIPNETSKHHASHCKFWKYMHEKLQALLKLEVGLYRLNKYTLFFYKQQVYKQVTSQVSAKSNGGSLRTHFIIPISKWYHFIFSNMTLDSIFSSFFW